MPDLTKMIDKPAKTILDSNYVNALVGAGMSVESGIPPFRGPGGLWTKYGEPDGSSFERFLDDPKGWWTSYSKPQGYMKELVETIESAKPNPAHYALVEMEKLDVLKHIISQNVDNLHVRAGSKALSEIHGNMFKLRCIACHQRYELDEISREVLPPHCPCGGLIKTDGVMFGEPIPPKVLDRCQAEAEKCDCMILIGTSGTIYPAAGFPATAKYRGAKLIEVNPYETPFTGMCEVILRAPAAESMPKIVKRLKELKKQ
jgi:NAD-dependent deacetylase